MALLINGGDAKGIIPLLCERRFIHTGISPDMVTSVPFYCPLEMFGSVQGLYWNACLAFISRFTSLNLDPMFIQQGLPGTCLKDIQGVALP